jgi:predicted RNA-binding Zn ribbon-like protein
MSIGSSVMSEERVGVVSRFKVVEAPGELATVQSLLNTAAVPKNGPASPDLLDAPDTAAAWLASLGAPTDQPGLGELRRLRDTLRAALIRRDHEPAPTDPTGSELTASMPLRLHLDGTLTTGNPEDEPTAQRVLRAVYAAQVTGEWSRMKVCRNPECRVAFWDSSRNSSAVWHDSRTCGNLANLRNSRARRRTTGTALPAEDADHPSGGRTSTTTTPTVKP